MRSGDKAVKASTLSIRVMEAMGKSLWATFPMFSTGKIADSRISFKSDKCLASSSFTVLTISLAASSSPPAKATSESKREDGPSVGVVSSATTCPLASFPNILANWSMPKGLKRQSSNPASNN